MGQMEQSTKATLEPKDIDLQHSSPSLSPQDNELVARAYEQLAHPYEQIASADEQLARLNKTVLGFEQEGARYELCSARDRPALRGMIGLLLAGCIFVAAFVAQSSYGDAARLMILQWYPQLGSAPSLPQENPELAQTNASAVQIVGTGAAVRQPPVAQPTPQDTVAPAASIAPELAQMLQSLSQSTEQLKVSQEQNARDIARVSSSLRRPRHKWRVTTPMPPNSLDCFRSERPASLPRLPCRTCGRSHQRRQHRLPPQDLSRCPRFPRRRPGRSRRLQPSCGPVNSSCSRGRR